MSNSLGRILSVITRFALLGAIAAVPSAGLAHSVIVWAETVGDQVEVESYLSNGARAEGGRVLILDEAGDTLLQGRLNDEGRFRFAPPEGASDLTIRVIFSSGHAGKFDLELRSDRPGSGSTPR